LTQQQAWLLLILLLLAAAVAFIALHGAPGGRAQNGPLDARTVAYAPCLRPEAREALQAAAERLGLRVVRLEPSKAAAEPPKIYVGDAATCSVKPLAEAAAAVLEEGGVAVLVGRPREISWVFKNETRVIMAYPLPYTNQTIIYAVRVVGYRWETLTLPTTTTVRMAVPEVRYERGISAEAFYRVLATAATWVNATAPAGR